MIKESYFWEYLEVSYFLIFPIHQSNWNNGQSTWIGIPEEAPSHEKFSNIGIALPLVLSYFAAEPKE